MDDLKPCPFCGGEDLSATSMSTAVACPSCAVIVPREAWNRRVLPPDVREALERILDQARSRHFQADLEYVEDAITDLLAAYPEPEKEGG